MHTAQYLFKEMARIEKRSTALLYLYVVNIHYLVKGEGLDFLNEKSTQQWELKENMIEWWVITSKCKFYTLIFPDV